MNDNLAVKAENLRKEYRRADFSVLALDDVDLEVPRGRFLALMGPSGSGKSTLLHLAAGIDKPTRGRIHVLGDDIAQLSDKQLARWRSENIGFVFQTFNLIPLFTHDPRAPKFAHSTRHLGKGQLLPEGRLPAD